MPLKFRNPNPRIYVNTLIYAGPKVGKTTLAASGPPGILYMNCDLDNALTFAKSRHPEGDILDVDFNDGIYGTMVDVASAVYEDGQSIAQTVVVDPIGELHRRLLEEFSKSAVRPTLNQYGDTSTQIERFCRALCEAPIHTVFVCHEQTVRDETSGEVERLPFTGTSNTTLGQKLMAMVDIIAYAGVRNQTDGQREYIAQLVPGFGRRGGDRFDCLAGADGTRLGDLSEWINAINDSNTTPPAAPAALVPESEPQEAIAA